MIAFTPPAGGSDSDLDANLGASYYAWARVTAWPDEVSVRVHGEASPFYAFSAQAAQSGYAFIAWGWVGSPEGGEVSCLAVAELAGGQASVDGRLARLGMEAEATISTPLTGLLFVRTRAQLASNGSVLVQTIGVPLPGGGVLPVPLVSDLDGPNPAPMTIPPIRRQAYGDDWLTAMFFEATTRAEGTCSVSGTWFPFSHAEADGELPDGGTFAVALFTLCVPPEPPEPDHH